MHWLRIDRYYAGDVDDPGTFTSRCLQQCENAPCEVVCPVGATVHSAEGLNDMVYNRCVGTRYCSNNCPYKVRRFNFLLYADCEHAEPEAAAESRTSRCAAAASWRSAPTACSASTRRAIDAEARIAQIRDGEVVTACQAACPTDAIVFGDINDPNSQVSKRKRAP